MAQTVEEIVNDFLRDAQWKIAKLSEEMDELSDDGGYQYEDLRNLRRELMTWIDALYWGRHAFKDSGFTFLYAGENAWTDDEIVRECHLLRYKANLNPVPYISWNNYNPSIVSWGASATTGNTVSGATFPVGTLGQYLTFDASGNVIAASFPIYAGASESEDIFDYFLNRA